MFACIGTQHSIQISEYLYQYLEYEGSNISAKLLQQATVKLIKGSQQFVTTLSTTNITSLAHTGGTFAGYATAKSVARTIITDTTKSLYTAGHNAALRSIAFATGGTVALCASVFIEAPLLASGIYKTHRKKKFDNITTQEAKRQYTRQACQSAGVVLGATFGAIAGSFIPVPFLGTFLGTLAGTLGGIGTGKMAGKLTSHFIKDGIVPDCAIIISHIFETFPEHKPE